MNTLKIALLQALPAGWDQQANLVKGERLCRQARVMKADVALFPEMWNIGYRFYDASSAPSRAEWEVQAIDTASAFVGHFVGLARELDMAIALTYLQKWEPGPRNVVSLIDRHGQVRMTYAKVHPCEFAAEAALTPGDGFHVCALDTAIGNVLVGAMICYDREFPESARILMLQGAEIILTPNACTLEEHRLGQYKARAFENMVGLAMANYPAPPCNGHSIAVDPIAFSANGGSRNTVVVEAGEGEGIVMAEFDMQAIREYRRSSLWGNTYRKTGAYALLLSRDVNEPFIRSDARR